MLAYDEDKDLFYGDDDIGDDDSDIHDLDDLFIDEDEDEVDPDTLEPDWDDADTEFSIDDIFEFGGPGSGRYPAGSGGNTEPSNAEIHAHREKMGLPDTPSNYRTAKRALTEGKATPSVPTGHVAVSHAAGSDVESKIRNAYNAISKETGRTHVPIADVVQRSGLPIADVHKWITDPKNPVNLNELDQWNEKYWASVDYMGRKRGVMEIFK